MVHPLRLVLAVALVIAPAGSGWSSDMACYGSENTYEITGLEVTNLRIVEVDPEPAGSYHVSGDSLYFSPLQSETSETFKFRFEADYFGYTLEIVRVITLEECVSCQIAIERTHDTYQGQHEYIDVTLESMSHHVKGFDLLFGYDHSALSFMAALERDLYEECGWEYFEYRFGAYGNCDACPSGMVRVVGIAETNNGPYHPSCYTPTTPATLFTLDFLVTDDRSYECAYLPVRFFWYDCGDNSIAVSYLSDPVSVYQGVSQSVWEPGAQSVWEPERTEITDSTTGFPTWTGYQVECIDDDPHRPDAHQIIEFINGAIEIICATSIDACGDINLNGTAYEIADAVLFSNYFVHGVDVFNVNTQGQIASSDVNHDGRYLTVADLVYLNSVVHGTAVPYSKLEEQEVLIVRDDDLLITRDSVGGAVVVVQGNHTPILLAGAFQMLHHFDGENTRVLLFSPTGEGGFIGPFLRIDGDVISLDLATTVGAVATMKTGHPLPSGYQLHRNYPNPFNAGTHISFDLPQPGKYSIEIYNTLGQRVHTKNAHAEAGTVDFYWDAGSYASGVYFYRVTTDGFTETRSMVLLK